MKLVNNMPRELREYIFDENLKVTLENFDNILWVLYWKNISVKEKMHIYMQRYVLAHELWHYYHWHNYTIDYSNFSNNPYEKEADEYAINQLVNTDELKEKIKENWSLDWLENYFWVPKEEILKKIRKIFRPWELNFYF